MPNIASVLTRCGPLIVLIAILSVLVTGCTSATKKPAAASPTPTVNVSLSNCGQGWQPSRAGHQQLRLTNTDSRSGEVYVADASTGALFGYVEPLGAGTSADLSLDLGAGRYRIECVMEDADPILGPVVTLTGSSTVQSPSVLPVSDADLIPYVKRYQAYVTRTLPSLATATHRLEQDIASGQLVNARRDWLPAHLSYERLGAAYGAFGDADGAINATADGLPGGVRDDGFTGFHRIEYGLWHGQSAVALVPAARALDAAVSRLIANFASAQIDPLEVAIRAHEITENALQFELTGRTDYGSHSNLATVDANLAGTVTVLDILKPLIATRYSAFGSTLTELAAAQQDLARLRSPSGGLPALSALTRSQHERVDADLSELSELLAPVASICEPRRSA
ncbi:MAG: Peptidase Imelysin [Frankiales bacterium]|nr:Peptidase Imelysin [Frankiales bacterium]